MPSVQKDEKKFHFDSRLKRFLRPTKSNVFQVTDQEIHKKDVCAKIQKYVIKDLFHLFF